MKINLKVSFPLLVFLPIFLFLSCSQVSPCFEKTLGTVCFVNLYENGSEADYDEIFERLFQIDDEFNIGKPDSDLAKINARASFEWVSVCDDVFTVLEVAQKVSGMAGGAFDISVEPLVSLWNVNTPSPHVATQEEIDERLPLVDFRNIMLNSAEKSVRFLKEGMKIDLGGIAKGFAADEIVKICKKNKIRRAVIDLGGNIYVYGKKSPSKSWTVGVKNPEYPDEVPLLKLVVPQISVVTSGIYERFFDEDGERYHHILSPKSGYPVQNGLYSVSVFCENSMLSDALSTAFFVLGREESLKRLQNFKNQFETEISVIFIEKDHKIYLSEGFPYKHEVLYDDWSL